VPRRGGATAAGAVLDVGFSRVIVAIVAPMVLATEVSAMVAGVPTIAEVGVAHEDREQHVAAPEHRQRDESRGQNGRGS